MKALKPAPGQVGWVEPRKEAGQQPPVMPIEEFHPARTPQTTEATSPLAEPVWRSAAHVSYSRACSSLPASKLQEGGGREEISIY